MQGGPKQDRLVRWKAAVRIIRIGTKGINRGKGPLKTVVSIITIIGIYVISFALYHHYYRT
jgi:hypothetical protein